LRAAAAVVGDEQRTVTPGNLHPADGCRRAADITEPRTRCLLRVHFRFRQLHAFGLHAGDTRRLGGRRWCRVVVDDRYHRLALRHPGAIARRQDDREAFLRLMNVVVDDLQAQRLAPLVGAEGEFTGSGFEVRTGSRTAAPGAPLHCHLLAIGRRPLDP